MYADLLMMLGNTFLQTRYNELREARQIDVRLIQIGFCREDPKTRDSEFVSVE